MVAIVPYSRGEWKFQIKMYIIRQMDDLRRIDLNLLLTLHALLAEKHVTRAALRLHRSQPAVSHSLTQLRRIFNDPLLIRHPGGMVLSPRAQDLLQPLESALLQLNSLLHQGCFDPRLAKRRLRVAMSDYAAHLMLPSLMRHLRLEAPGIDIAVLQASREAMLAQLADGEIDLAVGVFPQAGSEIVIQTLFDEHFVCVADIDSLPDHGRLSVEQWLCRPHVLVAARPDSPSEIDAALAQAGLQRRIALVLPYWQVSGEMVRGTDLILTVASRTLKQPSADDGLRHFRPPVVLPGFALQQAWHRRRDADLAHHWFRRLVRQCSGQARAGLIVD